MTWFKKRQLSDGHATADTRLSSFVWLSMTLEPVELRWDTALAGQWSILEAVIHGR
ncbi:hypothetical protein D3C71_997950 [compost metagenome]